MCPCSTAVKYPHRGPVPHRDRAGENPEYLAIKCIRNNATTSLANDLLYGSRQCGRGGYCVTTQSQRSQVELRALEHRLVLLLGQLTGGTGEFFGEPPPVKYKVIDIVDHDSVYRVRILDGVEYIRKTRHAVKNNDIEVVDALPGADRVAPGQPLGIPAQSLKLIQFLPYPVTETLRYGLLDNQQHAGLAPQGPGRKCLIGAQAQ